MYAPIYDDETLDFNSNVVENGRPVEGNEDGLIAMECGYCFGSTINKRNKLIRPCHCRAYLHQQCIRRAIDASDSQQKICTVCLYEYDCVETRRIVWKEFFALNYMLLFIAPLVCIFPATTLTLRSWSFLSLMMIWAISAVLSMCMVVLHFIKQQSKLDYLVVEKKNTFHRYQNV